MNDALYEQLVPRKQKNFRHSHQHTYHRSCSRCCCFRNASGRFSVISYRSFDPDDTLFILSFQSSMWNMIYDLKPWSSDRCHLQQVQKKTYAQFWYSVCRDHAPKKSPRLNAFHPDKTYDFTSGNENADVYAVMISLDQKTHAYISNLTGNDRTYETMDGVKDVFRLNVTCNTICKKILLF